jgi:hypothetical protein
MSRIALAQNPSPGQLPFLDVAFEAGLVKMGETIEVDEVSESKKRSGYVLRTEKFMIFLWKSSEMIQPLIGELERYSQLPDAPSLWLEVSDQNVEGFELFFETSQARQWVKSKKKFVLDLYSARTIIGTRKTKS